MPLELIEKNIENLFDFHQQKNYKILKMFVFACFCCERDNLIQFVNYECLQDGRLKLEDRLLEVNGMSLIHSTNLKAMEILRHAAQKDGPEPGTISLVIARSKVIRQVHEFKIDKRICEEETMEPQTKLYSFRKPPSESLERTSKCCEPVFSLAASTSKAARNMSYQRATHESFLGDSVFTDGGPSPVDKNNRLAVASTIGGGSQPKMVRVRNDDNIPLVNININSIC